MDNKKLERTLLFENKNGKNDIVFDYKLALGNMDLKKRILSNSFILRSELGIEELVKVKMKIVDNLDSRGADLRLYVYKAYDCNMNNIIERNFSHAVKVSLGNDGNRNNWVSAEEEFSAKVFPNNRIELVHLIEDIALDIQMFYYYGYENLILEIEDKRNFSKSKVDFIMSKGMLSYLGKIEGADYISFASFCRNTASQNVNFKMYIQLWEKFVTFLDVNSLSTYFSEDNIEDICKMYPKGGQLSVKRIKKLLEKLPSGKYILVRTERKPKDYRQRRFIENRFGMEKHWKTGKIKIVAFKQRFLFKRMEPYVSIFEFDWKGIC